MRHQCFRNLPNRLTEQDIVERAEAREREETMPMSVRWFGKPWSGSLCEECPQVPVPVGVACVHCEEKIEADDSGMIYANGPAAHRNCFLRGVLGSVAHIEKRCGCYVVGSTEGDPPGLSARAAADAAVAAWNRRIN